MENIKSYKLPKSLVNKIIQYKSELVFRNRYSMVIKHIKKLKEENIHESSLWMDPINFSEFFFGHVLCYEENGYWCRIILPITNRRCINLPSWSLK